MELLPVRERRQPGITEQFLPVAWRRSRVTSLTIASGDALAPEVLILCHGTTRTFAPGP